MLPIHSMQEIKVLQEIQNSYVDRFSEDLSRRVMNFYFLGITSIGIILYKELLVERFLTGVDHSLTILNSVIQI